MKLFRLAFFSLLCAACGSNASENADANAGSDAASDAGDGVVHADDQITGVAPKKLDAEFFGAIPNVFEGQVAGFGLDVAETVFVEGTVDMGYEAPVLVIVQSATPGICKHLQNGTYPKDGTFFPIALIQNDGEPIAAHRAYLPAGDAYFTFAQLRHFNASCSIQPNAEDGLATEGRVVLDSYTKNAQAIGRFEFQVGQAQPGHVRGSFNASFCDAPELFENYASLLNPVIDSEHCL